MSGASERCRGLEQVLTGTTSAVLELNFPEKNIKVIKKDLKKLGYEVPCEIWNEQQKIYHIHIIKSPVYKNA